MLRMQTLAKMTKAALKIWQFVARYTTKPLLCQGVEGDIAMAKTSRRRAFVDAKEQSEPGKHIAFDDMSKLITVDKAALCTPPAPRVQVVALANWESAPTFVLDEHLDLGFPKASTDRLFNKCNPFLSGKRRAHSEDDIASEAPTVSTDCSTIPEHDCEELDVVEEEVDFDGGKGPITPNEQTRAVKSGSKIAGLIKRFETNKPTQRSGACSGPKKLTSRWVRISHCRYVKACQSQQCS